MTVKEILDGLCFKGHVVLHLWQNGYWNPIGGGDADKVSKRFGFFEVIQSRVVDGILIIRVVFKSEI